MTETNKCQWCGLDHEPGGPSKTKEWIACREALGNEIVKLTKKVKSLKEQMELYKTNEKADASWMEKAEKLQGKLKQSMAREEHWHNFSLKWTEVQKELEAEIKFLRSTLGLIHDLAVDYDGYREAKNLMGLIDELKAQATDGLNWEYKKDGPETSKTS